MTTLFIAVNAVRSIAVMLEPFIPFSCERIWHQLGMTDNVHLQPWSSASQMRIPAGHSLGKVEPIFCKIEREIIEQQKKVLASTMVDNLKRGLMVGRFQPFHKGHLCLVGQIFEDCDELVIAIGSAQINYTYTDPFTAGERIMMIHAALVESKIDLIKCHIVPVVNDENNARWFGHLKSMVPYFDILYSGNEFVTNLVTHQTKILKPRFSRMKQYNGTNIRKLMSRSHRWKKFVPDSVAGIIEQIDGVNRIRFLLNEKLSEREKNARL